MKRLKEILKYKKALILLGIIILSILLWFSLRFSEKEKKPLGPVIVREIPQTVPYLNLISINPPSDDKSQKSEYYITLKFDKPLDVSTLKYEITPDISLLTKVPDENKDTLIFYPANKIWLEDTKYVIKIISLGGLSEEVLEQPVLYNYYYIPLEYTEAGESWMLNPDVDQNALKEYLKGHKDYELLYGESPQ